MADRPETFRSSGSIVIGGITVVASVVLGVLAALHPNAGAPDWITAGLFLFAVLVYIAQVRPAITLGESDLVLRNMLDTVHVPWAAIKDARVRQFLTVEVGRRTYDCAAVGRTRRQIAKDSRAPDAGNPAELSYGRFIETKIRNRAKEAMVKKGIELRSEEQDALAEGVETERAWFEIALLAVTVVALVVTIVL